MRISLRVIGGMALLLLCASFAAAQEGVIDWRKLGDFLPESFNGGEMDGTPQGGNTDLPTMKSSNARARYGETGAYTGSISISHLPTSDGDWTSQKKLFAMTKPSDSDWSKVEVVDIKGYTTIIAWMKKQNMCTVNILLDNGVSVSAELRGADSIATAQEACGVIDLDGLSGLKP